MFTKDIITTLQRFFGLSGDDKSTITPKNGAEFLEIDTGKRYLYDEDSGEWFEQPTGGGGGGGIIHGTFTAPSTTTTGQVFTHNANLDNYAFFIRLMNLDDIVGDSGTYYVVEGFGHHTSGDPYITPVLDEQSPNDAVYALCARYYTSGVPVRFTGQNTITLATPHSNNRISFPLTFRMKTGSQYEYYIFPLEG